MDNFKTIYLILCVLEKALDGDLDPQDLDAARLGISSQRRNNLLLMMQEAGYIAGLSYIRASGMEDIRLDNVRITLKGLEYMEENSMMKKAYRMLKGIKDITPGI